MSREVLNQESIGIRMFDTTVQGPGSREGAGTATGGPGRRGAFAAGGRDLVRITGAAPGVRGRGR